MRTKILLYLLGSLCFLGVAQGPRAPESRDTIRLHRAIAGPHMAPNPYDSAGEWISRMQHPSGLVESAAHTNFVSLYDNALAALLFIETGQPEKARHIFDFFQDRLEPEFAQTGGGFYQFRDTLGNEGSRVWMGDNAWLLIALRQHRLIYGSTKYDGLVHSLESWLRSLQNADGSLRGGVNEDGSPIPRVTEGMITAYAAVPGFDAFHRRLLDFLRNERWDDREALLLTERSGGRYDHALDLHTLSALIWGKPAAGMLNAADRYFNIQRHSQTLQMVAGYCFDQDRDVIWLEGSAQMALALRVTGQEDHAGRLLRALEQSAIPSTRFPGLMGLPYSANQGSNFGRDLLWPHADQRPAVSSTVWYLLAIRNFNPFALGDPARPMPGDVSIP